MMPNITYIDDLLDLDDPAQKGAFNKIANRESIKSMPDPNGSVPNGKLIESFNEQPSMPRSNIPGGNLSNSELNIRGPGHSGFNHREQFTPGMGHGMYSPGMGPPGMGPPGMSSPGMGPGMGPPGMSSPGMPSPGMGPPGGRAMSPPRETFQTKMPRIIENYKPELSCRDVADHITNCPICSKLYKQKRTGYIIAIIVLVIINLILLNKVFSSL
jgi:hypothetical protein